MSLFVSIMYLFRDKPAVIAKSNQIQATNAGNDASMPDKTYSCFLTMNLDRDKPIDHAKLDDKPKASVGELRNHQRMRQRRILA